MHLRRSSRPVSTVESCSGRVKNGGCVGKAEMLSEIEVMSGEGVGRGDAAVPVK